MTSSSVMEEWRCLKDGGKQGGKRLTQKTGCRLRPKGKRRIEKFCQMIAALYGRNFDKS